jgi:rhomboid protease GluP
MPTYALIVVNVAVFAFTSMLSGNFVQIDGGVLVDLGGQVNLLVLNGEVWRLFTAMFLHAGIAHIFGNMLFLLIFGLRAEDMFDIKEYLLVYLLSGLAGNLLTLLWPDPYILSVGASGAIFGVLGATIIYVRRTVGQSIMTALVYAFFLFLINSIGPGVNPLAHLGGVATGLLVGYALAAFRRPKPKITYEYRYPDSWGKAGY